MSKHTNFILSPISMILTDLVSANRGVGNGIETYPLSEYILQSVFLKMTGFHEQKMKCICWELATDDYEYRYDYLNSSIGEASRYKDKNRVYSDLVKQINKKVDFTVSTVINRDAIMTSVKSEVKEIFLTSTLLTWVQESFFDYETIISLYGEKSFATDNNNLFAETPTPFALRKIYDDYLIRHRNRCAHNTLSYQENLPDLHALTDDNYKYYNYFLWFALMILLDKIFIELFSKYLEVKKEDY